MRAHEAGALHADLGSTGPSWLRTPADVNALVPILWPQTVKRGQSGAIEVGGVEITQIARQHGTPAYIFDEADFRARCRAFKEAFGGAEVYYAGKAFIATAIVRILVEEGLSLDVCTGGELAVALRGGMPPERIGLHGNNKSVPELEAAVEHGVGRIIVDSFDEIDRLQQIAIRTGRRPNVLVRVTVGVEAHTHEFIATAHEDQKFGFSLSGGAAAEAVDRILADDILELRGLHSHIGSQIFDASGFEVAARRLLTLQARIAEVHKKELPEMDLGGGFGIAYTTQDEPAEARDLAGELLRIVKQECAALHLSVPHLSVGRSSGRRCSRSTRSARSRTWTASGPTCRWTAG
jgi:diaminopimelate decarboxylase